MPTWGHAVCTRTASCYVAHVRTSSWDRDRFRDLLEEIQGRASLSDPQLAALAGRSRSQVNRWTRAEHQPTYEPLRKLVDGLERHGPEIQALGFQLLEAAGYAPPDSGQVDDSSPPGDRPPNLTESLAMVRVAIEAAAGTLSEEELKGYWNKLRELEQQLLFGLKRKQLEHQQDGAAQASRRAAEN